ncbi:MAG: hypothetical protein HLX50_17260, partial [Alteromonadaceae bacterium]|nr:hypothetical protein [Alteromonadaceae bacterium]
RAPHRNPWGLHSSQSEYFKAPLSTCNSALLAVDANIQQIILGAPNIPDLEGLEHALSVALAHVDKALDLLSTHCRINGGYYVGEAAMLHNDLVRAQYALEDAESLMISVDTSAAYHGELLLTGDAGVGKTHLLCDVALDRIRSGKPTMMVLGQNFEGAFPLLQLPRLLGFHGTIDDLLELLNAAGEAEQHKALLIIDAINESRAPQHWADAVRELRSKASRFAYVGIVISCRSGFVDDLLEDTDMPKAIHRGFEPSMNAAVQHFTKVYGLEMPTFPIFNPEFGNPLFLRLTCESIKTQGLTRFQPGSNGISSICDSFLDSVNLQLSKPNRCNFNAKKNLVHSEVRKIAQFDEMHLESSVVEAITDEILPGRNLWTSHLMKGLIDEGLLIEIGDSHVAFGYQRLGEIARTKEIASKSIQEIQEWLSGKLAHQYAVRGTLDALAVTLPENHDVELIDLLNVDGAESSIAVYGFIESLTSREPSSIRPRTLALVEELLAVEYFASELRSQLIRLACIPDHPLNANFLHVYLVSQDLSDRDTEWSAWLFRALETEENSPVKTLIEWAWPLNDEDVYGMDAETAYLATLTMGWCLSTSDRAVRDSATKALVSIGEK